VEPVQYYAMIAGVTSSILMLIVGYLLGKVVGRRDGVKFIMGHFPTMNTGEFLIFLEAAKRQDIIFKPIPSDEFKNEVAH